MVMKRRIYIGVIAVFAAVLLIGGTPLTVSAATANGYYTAEEMRQQAAARQKALDNAIASGQIPKGTTVDDCYFSTNKDGTISVVTKAEIDSAAAARQPATTKPATNATAPAKLLTENELEAYAQEVFELVNKERESAGVGLLVRDDLLDEAANIRAKEIRSVYESNGKAHTRPNGDSWRTVLAELGIEDKCGENAYVKSSTPETAMAGWMKSDGHRENIIKERYNSIGIGVYQHSDGSLSWVQIFSR